MTQSGHLNPSEEHGTGCTVISKYGRTPLNKHGGVGRQQQGSINDSERNRCQDKAPIEINYVHYDTLYP